MGKEAGGGVFLPERAEVSQVGAQPTCAALS